MEEPWISPEEPRLGVAQAQSPTPTPAPKNTVVSDTAEHTEEGAKITSTVDRHDAESTVTTSAYYGPENADAKTRRVKDAVVIETCNGTSSAAVKDRLLYSQADAILAQEHRLLKDDIAEQTLLVGVEKHMGPGHSD